MPFAYLDVCAGLSAPTAAWRALGATALAYAEIDPFAAAVLAARYGAGRPRFMPSPDDADDPKEASRRRNAIKALDRIPWGDGIPNEGDFTRLRDEPFIVNADVLVGGTPCQGFSLAGLRGSLSDDRSNLCLEFVRLLNAIDDLRRDDGRRPAVGLWENVPGVLNTDDNAFGAFLGGLVGSESPLLPPRGAGWTDAGVASGPRRMAAWRTLDAQHFGLAQRRRRVFVLTRGHSGGRSVADALLPLIDSMRGHPAPRRKKGQGVARSLTASLGGPSAKEQQYTFVAGRRPLNDLDGGGRGDGGRSPRRAGLVEAFGGNRTSGPIEVSPAILAKEGSGVRQDFESDAFVVEPIPYALAQITHPENRANPKPGDPAPTLTESGDPPAIIAFSAKDDGGDAGEIAPTLRAMEFHGSHPNSGGQIAVAVNFEHGLAPHGSLQPKEVADEITASEAKGHTVVFAPDVAEPLLSLAPGQGHRGTDSDSLNYVAYAAEIAGTLMAGEKAAGSATNIDAESGLLVATVAPALTGTPYRDRGAEEGALVAYPISRDAHTRSGGEANGLGVGADGAPASTVLAGGPAVAVAFSMRGRDGENVCEPEADDVAPALRTGGGTSSKPHVAIAFQERGRDGERSLELGGDRAYALTAPTGGGRAQERLVAYSLSPGAGSDGLPSAVETDVAPAITAEGEARKNGRGTHVLQQEPFAFKPSHYTRDKDGAPSTIAPPLTADADKGDQDAIVFQPDAEEIKAFTMSAQSNGFLWESDVHPTLMAHPQSDTSNRQVGVRFGSSAVRRLTPRECERLQGYADDFTLIPYSEARRSDDDLAETIAYLLRAGYAPDEAALLANTPDGPRYRALGNSMATDVIEELGHRIVWLLEGDA